MHESLILTSSIMFSRQASVQIENLQEQLQAIAAQRDRAVMDLASIQEQAHQYQTSLSNLQLVLEQFQRGKICLLEQWELQCWHSCYLTISFVALERESQLRATQEQAQKEIGKAWAQVKDLQAKENQLKVWHVIDILLTSFCIPSAAHKKSVFLSFFRASWRWPRV